MVEEMTAQRCMYCGREPDSGGVILHAEGCAIEGFGRPPQGSIGGREQEPGESPGPVMWGGLKAQSTIEQRIREICSEEVIAQRNMEKNLAAFAGQVAGSLQPCSQCAKLPHQLELAKIALRKISGRRSGLGMSVDQDIAELTLREIEREE